MTLLEAVPDHHDDPADDEHIGIDKLVWSAQEAADRCGVEKKTILRKAAKLLAAGATKGPNGVWRIRPSHLKDIGLQPNVYMARDPKAVPDEPVPVAPAPPTTMIELAVAQAELRTARIRIAEMDAELRILREERSTFQAAAKAAEAVAQEREYTINDLRRDRQLTFERLTAQRWRPFRRQKEITAGPTPTVLDSDPAAEPAPTAIEPSPAGSSPLSE